MGGKFIAGESKTRPGNYFRFSNAGTLLFILTAGIAAAIAQCTWGPLNTVISITDETDVDIKLGALANTVNCIKEILKGGARQIKVVRLGSGGTKSTITLKDTTAETAVDVVTLTAKYVGTRTFSVTIKDSLIDATKRECILYEGTSPVEKVLFAKGSAGEVDAIVAAFAGSIWVDAAKLAAGNGIMAALTQSAMTPGTQPAALAADYSAALNVLETTSWDGLAIDTNDTAMQALVSAFIDRIIEGGKLAYGVIGEPTSVALATRQANAAAFNNPAIVYVANGFIDDAGAEYEGYKAAARLLGMMVSSKSNVSLTHTEITGAVDVKGALTDTEIIQNINNGAVCFTQNDDGAVWIESAINTLVTLTDDQDAGWKKIRRTLTRFELVKRINAATGAVKVNNNPNGTATIMSVAQGVINTMINEGKLEEGGTITLDPLYPASGDAASFVIQVDDLDTIEKSYFNYKFRFSA